MIIQEHLDRLDAYIDNLFATRGEAIIERADRAIRRFLRAEFTIGVEGKPGYMCFAYIDETTEWKP